MEKKIYKVFDKGRKQFHNGGMSLDNYNKFGRGKVWKAIGHLKLFLRQYFPLPDFHYKNPRNCIPDSWEVVVYEMIEIYRVPAQQFVDELAKRNEQREEENKEWEIKYRQERIIQLEKEIKDERDKYIKVM